jgi:hypothetical protein
MQQPGPQWISGRVISFDRATGALALEHGSQTPKQTATVYVDQKTSLTLDGKTVGLDQLIPGEHVTVETAPGNVAHPMCVSVLMRAPRVPANATAKHKG